MPDFNGAMNGNSRNYRECDEPQNIIRTAAPSTVLASFILIRLMSLKILAVMPILVAHRAAPANNGGTNPAVFGRRRKVVKQDRLKVIPTPKIATAEAVPPICL